MCSGKYYDAVIQECIINDKVQSYQKKGMFDVWNKVMYTPSIKSESMRHSAVACHTPASYRNWRILPCVLSPVATMSIP